MTPPASPDSPCPCCSETPFARCCQPYLSGSATPPTALQLMRSRYAAFQQGNLAYLIETHHPSTRDNQMERDIRDTFENTQWIGLEILDTSAGGPNDKKGTVTFAASYQQNGTLGTHTERSRFTRHNGKWRYLDGKVS